MKGSAVDILVKYLEQEGVEYLFGIPGGHLLPLYDAIYKSGTIKPILARHEAGAAFMAHGYAVASGKIGVCCGTVGPGATNLITGVASAYMDSVPLLVLTAQVGTTSIGKGALQEGAGAGRTINQVRLFESITKLSTMELNASTLSFSVKRALRTALSGRPGPVHMDLPANIQGQAIEEDIEPISGYRSVVHGAIDSAQVRQTAELLLQSQKPAMLIGYGAAVKDISRQIMEIAENLQIPVATTLRAKGIFPEDHPLALGCVGLYGTRAANSYLRSDTDVLLSIGASMHEFTSHCWDPAFAPSKAFVQVDIDATEVGKNFQTSVPVVADSGVFASALREELGGRKREGEDLVKFKTEKEYFDEPAMESDSVPIKPQRLMRDLGRALPRNTTVFADIGNTVTWAERYLSSFPEGCFSSLSGLAAMGSATAAIIGGKLGRPDSPAVCLCGDGDFHMTGMEVASAANHRIPVVWIVLKNDRLGMIHDVQANSYQNRYIAADITGTDFVQLAEALGAQGIAVTRPQEIEGAIETALAANGPVVIEVEIDPDEMPPVKPRMLALKRSLGNPDVAKSISWSSVKAVWQMIKER